jgi:nucleoside-diphosphate-sugar epimerase
MASHVLITGATGLIGGEVLVRLLRSDHALTATVLLRSPRGWPALAERLGPLHRRVALVPGDARLPGLGLDAAARARLAALTDLIVHCAADTRFSQPLPHARRTNRDGTRRLLELAAACGRLERLVHVSTAFVAGRMTGPIPEAPLDGGAGWVNAYEQSKHEAEGCVRASGLPAVIARPSTVVCDGVDGRISQINAVHRALLLCRAGLAAMVPGGEDTLVDLVTTDYVGGGITRLALQRDVPPGTYHLCAGARALPLGELLDRAFAHWSHDGRWRRRGVARPSLASLDTYRLFEASVYETGDDRLRAITRSLTHFVPQLALPKQFDTSAADAAVGGPAPAVRDYWDAVLQQLALRRTGGRAA